MKYYLRNIRLLSKFHLLNKIAILGFFFDHLYAHVFKIFQKRDSKNFNFLKQTKLQRRSIALLEVLISFALVSLCALPLIYPLVAIFKAEKQFVSIVDLDHAVNLLYANRLEKLYLKEIDWNSIQNGEKFSIESSLLEQSGVTNSFPFSGTFHFEEEKHKPSDREVNTVHLLTLIFSFTKKETKDAPLIYEYPIVIEYKPDEK